MVWSSGFLHMQYTSPSSSSLSPSGPFATDELRAGVTEPCLRCLGAGVMLVRLVAGVPVRWPGGVPSILSLSSLRLFAAGFTVLAVPFLEEDGAARFLLGAGLGFNEELLAELSTAIGNGV